ncbi:MAG: enoyl-CoA hydratase/isomerase family protein [Acidobacteriota bacterium]
MSNEINVESSGLAVVVTFARPESRNPLSVSVLEQLHRLVDDVSGDAGVERLVFTGAGDVFASGADLREIAVVTADGAREFAIRGQALTSKLATMPQPAIAAVNGICFGGALDLALACRVRIASGDALFSHPGSGLGIITGWGGTQRLPRLVGEAAALEMFFTGKRVGARQALAIGLIDAIADDPLAAALIFEIQITV